MARGAGRAATRSARVSQRCKRAARSPAEAISRSTALSSRFQRATSWPFSAKFNASAEPIVPTPITPICACVIFTSSAEALVLFIRGQFNHEAGAPQHWMIERKLTQPDATPGPAQMILHRGKQIPLPPIARPTTGRVNRLK